MFSLQFSNRVQWIFSNKRPEHKTSPRALVSNTMNCNCISESTSKLVKRLRQVFLLIKQSIPFVCIASVSFPFFKNNSSASFLNPACCFLSRLCYLPLVIALFLTSSFRYSLFSFLFFFSNLFVSIFYFSKKFCIQIFPKSKNIQLIV